MQALNYRSFFTFNAKVSNEKADRESTGISGMSTHSFYTRQMLSKYGRQLVSARRMARYEQLVGRPSPDGDSALSRRKYMVERVSRELIENLLFAGSENPVVNEVKKALEKRIGATLLFHYPPAVLDIQIFKISAQGLKTEVLGAEKRSILDALWEITLEVVDGTMM